MKFAWIKQHQDGHEGWSVTRLCRVLEVARSGYYAWKLRLGKPGPLTLRREKLLDQIKAAISRPNCVWMH